jgi:hypothetical protein
MSQPHKDQKDESEEFGPNAGRQSGPSNYRSPSAALQAAFDQLTGRKLHRDILETRLAKLGRGFGGSEDEWQEKEEAFTALATILESKPKLRVDVANYVADRHLLHKPFEKWLKENGRGALVAHLKAHTRRRALL